jgi:hypothetical protein
VQVFYNSISRHQESLQNTTTSAAAATNKLKNTVKAYVQFDVSTCQLPFLRRSFCHAPVVEMSALAVFSIIIVRLEPPAVM